MKRSLHALVVYHCIFDHCKSIVLIADEYIDLSTVIGIFLQHLWHVNFVYIFFISSLKWTLLQNFARYGVLYSQTHFVKPSISVSRCILVSSLKSWYQVVHNSLENFWEMLNIKNYCRAHTEYGIKLMIYYKCQWIAEQVHCIIFKTGTPSSRCSLIIYSRAKYHIVKDLR